MPSNVWDEVPDWGGGIGALRLDRAGGLGASVWELAPGVSQSLYHFHRATEELLVVLRGTPTVRMHDGERALSEGDVLTFARGTEGGHEIRNDGAETARVLIVSTNANPDIAEYPETGKVAYVVDGTHHYHRLGDAVDHAFAEATIHVRVLDEGVDVWRPVQAAHVGKGLYCIVEHSPPDERWEFAPGTVVVAEERPLNDGAGLVAVRRA